MTYKPASGGTSTGHNAYNPGAAICFDCHLTANSGTMPWGYDDTFNASQIIMGYDDAQYFGSGATGRQQRYSYKASLSQKGGHFGASSSLTTPVNGSIGGLCTPCHDPHGVSPSLGGNQAYGVPLLKGTWMTSPYKDDVAPKATNETRGGGSGDDGGDGGDGVSPFKNASTPGYHIDQNTFESVSSNQWNFSSTKRVTETVDQFGGLCLKCHPKSSIAPGTNSSWKSMDRIHNTVKGWGTMGGNNNNAVHSYTCSKCHAPHNSGLQRLLVTNCLNYTHRGQVVSGGPTPPTNSGKGGGDGGDGGDGGSGSGRFPAGGGGSGGSNKGPWFFGSSSGGRACHDNTNSSGYPSNQLWNTKSPW